MDWLQWLTASGAVGALGAALATFLRTRPAMKTAQVQGEAALWTRIAALETAQERERNTYEERIDRIERRYEADIKELKGEIQVLRHDRNNVRQGLNALLAMIKRIDNPELSDIAAAIEDMVARGDVAIATEKAALLSTKGTA